MDGWGPDCLPLTCPGQELFGPLSLQALEKDQYIRQIKGYLPDASVAFIDEVRHLLTPLLRLYVAHHPARTHAPDRFSRPTAPC